MGPRTGSAGPILSDNESSDTAWGPSGIPDSVMAGIARSCLYFRQSTCRRSDSPLTVLRPECAASLERV